MNSQLQLNRIDYGIKFKYAEQYLTHKKTSSYTRRTYLSHLRTWNCFIEDNKKSKDDFIVQFESILRGISTNGYDKFPSIQVSTDQNLVNGIHRLVACDALNIKPNIEYVRSPYRYDSNFIRSYRNPHDGSKFSKQLMEQIISTYIDTVSLNALLVLPRAIAIDGGDFIKKLFINDKRVTFVQRFKVPLNVLDLLVAHFYYDQQWCNTGEQINWEAISIKTREIKSSNTLQYVDFYSTSYSAEELVKIKRDIRSYYGIANSSIHSTDRHKDAKVVGQFLMSMRIVQSLWSTRRCGKSWVLNNFLIKKLISSSYEWNPDRMLVGSALNDIAGLRRAKDLDFLSRESTQHSTNIASHNEYEYLYSRPLFDLLDEPGCYFHLFGSKIISTTEYRYFKQQRNEEKDILDLRALSSIGV